MARYPALLWRGSEDCAVTFPDLPGCLAGAPTAEEALARAEEALGFHLEGLVQDKVAAPQPSSLDSIIDAGAPAGTILLSVSARPPKAPAVRVNITLDKNLLAAIDEAAVDAGTTRSGFLAEAARRLIGR